MKIRKISDMNDVNITSDGVATVSADRTITLYEISQALDGLGYTVVATK